VTTPERETIPFFPSFSGDFEAHVTVAPFAPSEADRFRTTCAALGAEPILIELPVGAGPAQPMTASRHHGTLADARREAEGVAAGLANARFMVRRIKIEASPFNADLPQTETAAAALPSTTYFEFHLKLLLEQDTPEDALALLCDAHGAHLSRNAFKKREDGKSERFVTLRCFAVGQPRANTAADCLATALTSAGFTVAKRVAEFCVYDTDASVDEGWTEGDDE